ncbi:sensor histidine kinase [Nocardioides caldifontis]|uniref:sensor histidine kinase n=1 Tax=Nocardioides caldifontis TaxID=2588938 RepID=UPI0011DF3156|nr:ATP-binding protein [Nocardioides caldifontis]
MRDETFERVRSMTGIARTLLDVRILLGLVAVCWLVLRGEEPWLVAGVVAAMGWLLLALLRWRTVGLVMCTHPAVLAVDTLACLAALAATEVMSPFLLLLGSGALMTGLCLDRTGAWFFSPLLVAGWWFVYTVNPPDILRTSDVFLQIVAVPALLAGVAFLGVGIRSSVLRAAETERLLREEMRSTGVAEERARMAREMHDSLIKSLHGLAMLADSLPAWVERSPERAGTVARQLSELIRTAGRESREVVLAMRRTDARSSVAEQVRQTVDRWRDTAGRPVGLTVDPEVTLATESAYELVAILGEALENVRRHTPEDSSVEVTLAEDHGWASLAVTDNGPGMPPERAADGLAGHFGLRGMRERAARVGGRLTVTSRPGVGTTVDVRLPAAVEGAEEQRELTREGGVR